ncbi:MAG TPA: hypothetical protein DD381_11805 [Lentisphaeria bacterium]|nr:hypothetical protein [Lentisphaeria bacterium]
MQVFDKEMALHNVMGSEEMLHELINTFITHNIDEQSMQIFCNSVRDNDIASIFRKTHNLKSTSLYVGASLLSKAIINLIEFTRSMIATVIQSSYKNIDDKCDENITQKEVDNAVAIIELKKTTEPVCSIVEKNNQELYEKFTFRIASELFKLTKAHAFDPITQMTEKILFEVQSYKSTVQPFLDKII